MSIDELQKNLFIQILQIFEQYIARVHYKQCEGESLPRMEMDMRRSASFEFGDVIGDTCHGEAELLALDEI